MTDTDDWRERLLAGREKEGRKDMDNDVYDPPYQDSDDPQDEAEKEAYDKGWWDRRKDLQHIATITNSV